MVTVRELIRMLVEDANMNDWVYAELEEGIDHVRAISIEKDKVLLVCNLD